MNTRWRWRLVGVALLLLCAPGDAAAQLPLGATADPVAGARLFRARGCAECHGGDLARLRQHRSFYGLAAAMWNHFPQMKGRIRAANMPAPYVTPDEMSDVIAFLQSSGPQEPASPDRPSSTPGDPARGQQVVAAKGCLACHSIAGPGGPRAGSLDSLKGSASSSNIVAQMWNHSFIMEAEATREGAGWKPLSADEMADLVAFLQSLMRAR